MKAQIVLLISSMCFSTMLIGQATVISNNSTDPDNFLGWDGFTNNPLDIKHENDRNIRFTTDNLQLWGVRNDGYVLGGAANPIQDALLSLRVNSSSGVAYSVYGMSERAIGGRFLAENGNNNVGLAGQSIDSETFLLNIGAYGGLGCSIVATFSAGVYGSNKGDDCPGESWAGYFNGDTFCPAGIWAGSDENLKSNVSPLINVQDMLLALEPKQYEFQQPESSDITLPQGIQFGLLAQELEAVIPMAVTNVVHAGGLESLSSDNEPLTFKGVNYQMLIPVLLAHFQDQQLSLQEAHAQLSEIKNEIQLIENRLAIEKYNLAHPD